MAHPDHALWKRGWRAKQIDFHLDHVHPLLIRFWAALGLRDSDRVFVPLCGKSLDLMWLRALGHDVVAVELSPIAVRDFFKASRLQAQRHAPVNRLTCWTQERLAIYCGDFFDLTRADLAGVRAAYDRAALGALPENLRSRYVAHLHAILPADCHVLLITVEDLDDGETEAAAGRVSSEIVALYAGRFDVELLHAQHHVATPGEPRCVHKVYRLQRRPS